jgi:hypothetical protein
MEHFNILWRNNFMKKQTFFLLIFILLADLMWGAKFKGICFGSFISYNLHITIKYSEPVFIKADMSKEALENLGNNDKISAIVKMKEKAEMIARQRGYKFYAISYLTLHNIGYSADLIFW